MIPLSEALLKKKYYIVEIYFYQYAVSMNTVLKDKVLQIEIRKLFVGMPENVLCS